MWTVLAGAVSQVPRPPTTATIAMTAANRASPLSGDRASEHHERDRVADQVAETAVQDGRERDADQALGIARPDAGRVEVAREEVDDLDHPHDGDQDGDEGVGLAYRSLLARGGLF